MSEGQKIAVRTHSQKVIKDLFKYSQTKMQLQGHYKLVTSAGLWDDFDGSSPRVSSEVSRPLGCNPFCNRRTSSEFEGNYVGWW